MDAAWKVIQDIGCDWCSHPCLNREGCGCADMVQSALDAEREKCAKWLEANGQPGYAVEIRHLKR